MQLRRNPAVLFVLAALCFAGSAFAEPEPVAQHNSTALWFENWIGLSNAVLTVQAPDGEISEVSGGSNTPVYRLERGAVLDGVYLYELRAATEETVKVVNAINNGRGEAAQSEMSKPFLLNGRFVVARGVIVTPEDLKEDSN